MLYVRVSFQIFGLYLGNLKFSNCWSPWASKCYRSLFLSGDLRQFVRGFACSPTSALRARRRRWRWNKPDNIYVWLLSSCCDNRRWWRPDLCHTFWPHTSKWNLATMCMNGWITCFPKFGTRIRWPMDSSLSVALIQRALRSVSIKASSSFRIMMLIAVMSFNVLVFLNPLLLFNYLRSKQPYTAHEEITEQNLHRMSFKCCLYTLKHL